MARPRTTRLTLLLAAVLGLAPVAPAAATTTDPGTTASAGTGVVRVQLRTAPTRIAPDGDVRVVMWTRCSPDVYLYELDVSVVQGDTVGSVTLLRGTDPLPVCDGERHRLVVEVPADVGRFRDGVAGIGAFLGAYSDATGDLEATDAARVRLYGR